MIGEIFKLIGGNGWALDILVNGGVEKEAARYLFGDFVQEIFAIGARKLKRIGPLTGLVRQLRKRRYQYALCQYGVDTRQFAALACAANAKIRLGWGGTLSFLNTRNLRQGNEHKVIETAKCLEPLGLSYSEEVLYVGKTRRQQAKPHPQIVFAPGSFIQEKHKRWPVDRYIQLGRELSEVPQSKIAIIGGEGEKEICREIALGVNSTSLTDYCGELSIVDSIKLIETATVAICNCNAISHVAAFCGVDTVAIYGPTNPSITGVFSSSAEFVVSKLSCAPCYRRGYTSGCGNPVCMASISVPEVKSRVLGILNRKVHTREA